VYLKKSSTGEPPELFLLLITVLRNFPKEGLMKS